MAKNTEKCFNISLTNPTALPVEYVLFANIRKPATLVNWVDLRNQFGVLAQKQVELMGKFDDSIVGNSLPEPVMVEVVPPPNASYLPNGSNFYYFRLDYVAISALFADTANAFTSLAQALDAQANASQTTELTEWEQIAQEVALKPIRVHEITIVARSIEQLQQTYLYDTKKSLLRQGKEKILDFYENYNPTLKSPQATLDTTSLGNDLLFDGTTGLRFTLLPNTSVTFKFCYEFVAEACCDTPPPPEKIIIKEVEKVLPAPIPMPPPKKRAWWFVLVALLLFLLCAFLLWWLMHERESS